MLQASQVQLQNWFAFLSMRSLQKETCIPALTGACDQIIDVGAKCDDGKKNTGRLRPLFTVIRQPASDYSHSLSPCCFLFFLLFSFPLFLFLFLLLFFPHARFRLMAVEDKCDAKAVCKGVDKCKAVTCKPKSQCHNIGVCNINDGVCSNPFTTAGVACNDKDPVTGPISYPLPSSRH